MSRVGADASMDSSVPHISMELVEAILHEHFGSRCAQVGECLIRRGPSPVFDIRAVTRLSFLEIRNCLLTLIQHNIVTFTAPPEPVLYTLDVPEALFRIRFARYALFVEQRRGPVARILMTEVLKCGRVTVKGVISQILDDLEKSGDTISVLIRRERDLTTTKQASHATDGEGGENFHSASERDDEVRTSSNRSKLSLKEPSLRSHFISLVADNFLIRVDPPRQNPNENMNGDDLTKKTSEIQVGDGCSATASPVEAEPATAKAKGGTAKTTASRKAATAKSSVKRRRGATSTDPALQAVSDDQKNENAGTMELLTLLNAASGGAVTTFSFQDTQNDGESLTSGSSSKELEKLLETMEQEKVVFRVNTRRMNLMLLCEMAENFMATRWAESRIVRYVTRILLQSARLQQSGTIITQGQTFHDVRNQLVKLAATDPNARGFKVPESNILLQLFDALDRTDKIIRNVTRDGVAMFIFDWERFKALSHDRLLFNAVTARHGAKAGRVWNLLRSLPSDRNTTQGYDYDGNKLWEDQQVADKALLPPHSARELLYRLCTAGFVRMHQSDIVTGAPATCASAHAFVFSASASLAKNQLLRDTYTMLLNILERKQYEVSQIARLMFSVTGLTEVEDHQLRQREAGEDRLEFSFLHLDATAILQLRDM